MNNIKKYSIAIVLVFGLCMFIKPALCFLILGIFFSYMGFAAVIFLNKIKKKGIEWSGTIIEYQSDSKGYNTPIIQFTTIKGVIVKEKPYVYATTDLSRIRTYSDSINQSIPILYDPNDPIKFVIKNEEGFNYFAFILFILIGLFFVGLSFSWLFGYINMD